MKSKFFACLVGISVLAGGLMILCIISLRYPVETPKYPRTTSVIDYIGDMQKFVTTTKGIRIDVDSKGNEETDFSVLAPITTRIDSTIQRSGTQLQFSNRFSDSDSFSLGLNVSNDSVVETVYDNRSHTLNFVIPAYRLIVSDKAWEVPTSTIGFLTNVPINTRLRIVGEKTFIFGTENKGLSISLGDLRKSSIVVLKQTSRNLLSQAVSSFENGTWSKSVSDCNKNGLGIADISMSISRDASSGYRSLLLSSNNHSACTNRSFDVNFRADHVYTLFFDYKNLEGESVQYYYRTGKGENAYQESQEFKAKIGNWKTFETPVEVKKLGVQPIDIYFYATSNGSKKVSNLYDSVRVLEFVQEPRQITFLDSFASQSVNTISLPVGQNTLNPERIDGANLLDKDTSSFENGFWTQTVADCNVRGAGIADISMSTSSDATDGAYSLKLASTNHPACTNKRFSVELRPDQIYGLSFDYKNIAGQSGQSYYKLQGKGLKSEYSQSLQPSVDRWASSTVEVVPDGISNGIDIYLYAPSSGDRVATLYDNVRLITLMPKNLSWLHVFREKQLPREDSARLEFRPMSAWKTHIKLHRLGKPVLLVVPNPFDRKMVASVRNTLKGDDVVGGQEPSTRNDTLQIGGFFRESKYIVPTSLHYNVNNYSNGWFIDPVSICTNKGVTCIKNSDGTYEIDLVIESPLERWFYLCLLVSATTIACCLGYFAFNGIRILRGRMKSKNEKV